MGVAIYAVGGKKRIGVENRQQQKDRSFLLSPVSLSLFSPPFSLRRLHFPGHREEACHTGPSGYRYISLDSCLISLLYPASLGAM